MNLYCELCGQELTARRRRYCDDCAEKGYYERQKAHRCEIRQMEKQRRQASERASQLQKRLKRATRVCRLSAEQLERLAWLYDAPYNSYGKLQGYIWEFDRLPPDSFLKKNREHNEQGE